MLKTDVMAAVLEFRRKRDWEQFHKPKELAAAMTVEVKPDVHLIGGGLLPTKKLIR